MERQRSKSVRCTFVIPAFNEASRLPGSLAELKAFAETLPYPVEVVVVNDGSTDNTVAVVRERMATWPALRLIEGPHQGKGGAVKAGVRAATGRYIAFADADFAMAAAEFARFTPALLERYPVAIGTREGPGAQRFNEPAYRHLMGRAFNKFVQIALLSGIQDTQCGFKVIRREVAQELCQRQTISGWGFDVELLVIARLHGYAITEVPIPWTHVAGSRVNPIRDTLTMTRDVFAIRRNLRRGIYSREVLPQHIVAPVPEQQAVISEASVSTHQL